MFRRGKSILTHPLGAVVAVACVVFLAVSVCSVAKRMTTDSLSADAVAIRAFNRPNPALWR